MRFAGVFAALALLGCEAPAPPRQEAGTTTVDRAWDSSAPPSTAPLSSEIAVAYQAPAAVIEAARGALDFGSQVIELATVLSNANSARTYGTLTEDMTGRVEYAPSPEDRLVIVRAGGQRFEVLVRELAGNGQDVASFFRGDHGLRLHVIGDDLDAEVWSIRRGTFREAGVRGDVVVEETTLRVDLRLAGTETFDTDATGTQLFDDHSVAGSIMRGQDGVDVDEHWTFELVSARRGATDGRMETASSVIRSVWSSAVIGDRQYEWQDVETRKAFRDGKPNELDTFWDGRGGVIADGAVVGTVEMFAEAVGESGGAVGFELKKAGDAVELERHAAY